MKQIKVVEKNLEIIQGVIDSIQGKSLVNCIDANQVDLYTQVAEEKLDELCIPKKYRTGAKFHYRPEGPHALSYKFGQGATTFKIVRLSTGWAVESIERGKVYPRQAAIQELILSKQQRDIAVAKFCTQFSTIQNTNEEVSQYETK